ncbi:cobalt ABC transporter, ATPase subunit [Paenibacillus curdlanolyticus YK9]|uniref:Cobalt ABC transporter, ATPase subunit n=1 Tax=Paenibacillus curdlanolyticus YK9 TaxID=717606 RepID=E0I922_9BACL|nr:cobalt ECF transporter T component CbiQ [Paenibacillus curdlanolyticus]EFM10906.1 cobalt ABC transporter, ATPase subunit [Paenibacillus curdlanolyticus YK9]
MNQDQLKWMASSAEHDGAVGTEQMTPPEKSAGRATKRLLAVLGLLATMMFFRHPAALMGAAGCFLFGMLLGGLPLLQILRRLLLIVPFALGAIVFVPFQHAEGGTELFRLFGWVATEEGMRHSIVLLLKVVNANLLITYLLLSTPLFQLIRSLRAIGIPAVLLEIIGLMLRYLVLLKEEAQGMVKAQRSRGLRLDGWLWSRSTYKRFGELLGVLFIRAYARSSRIYQSITARGGFGAGLTGRGRRQPIGQGGLGMAIDVRGVTYQYGRIQALRGLTFSIGQGAKVVLMGPNGAGKSTLISLLNGLEQPATGEVSVFGERMTRENALLLRQRIGVVYQDPDDQIFSTTVEEDVAFGPRNLGLDEQMVQDRVTEALRAVGMSELRSRSPFELSYGQKRRVAIAGVLAMRPEVVILDEPMAFLDPKSRDDLQALLERMHESGLTLIVATHDVDFAAEWATDVIVLKDGRLLASGSTELLFDDLLLEQADLHLPRLVRPFRLLQDAAETRPRTVRDAAQAIWQLIMRGPDGTLARSSKRMDGETRQREG